MRRCAYVCAFLPWRVKFFNALPGNGKWERKKYTAKVSAGTLHMQDCGVIWEIYVWKKSRSRLLNRCLLLLLPLLWLSLLTLWPFIRFTIHCAWFTKYVYLIFLLNINLWNESNGVCRIFFIPLHFGDSHAKMRQPSIGVFRSLCVIVRRNREIVARSANWVPSPWKLYRKKNTFTTIELAAFVNVETCCFGVFSVSGRRSKC